MNSSKLKNLVSCICLLFMAFSFSPDCAAVPFSQMTPEEREEWMDKEQEQFNRDYAAAQRQIAEGRRQQAKQREEFNNTFDNLVGFAAGAWVLRALAVVVGLGFLGKIANRKPERIIIREPSYYPRPANNPPKKKAPNNKQNQNQQKQNNSPKPQKAEVATVNQNLPVQIQKGDAPAKKRRRRKKKKKAICPEVTE